MLGEVSCSLFDVRWVAAEALTTIGDAAAIPLPRALVQRPGSLWLHEGIRYVFHGLRRRHGEWPLLPVLKALDERAPIRNPKHRVRSGRTAEQRVITPNGTSCRGTRTLGGENSRVPSIRRPGLERHGVRAELGSNAVV